MPRADSPTDWTGPDAVTTTARKLWERGHVLREAHLPAEQRTAFPKRIPLKGPRSEQIADHYAAVSPWLQQLRDAAARDGWRLEHRSMRAASLGTQQIPVVAWLDSPEHALAALSPRHRADAARYASLLAHCDNSTDSGAASRPVALARPLDVLDAGDDWSLLLAVTDWVAEHPRHGLHIRQVPIDGMHTKVMAAYRPLLARLLEARLPASAIDATAATFEGRYGFTTPAPEVRVRGRADALGVPASATTGPNDVTVTWPLSGLAALDVASLGITELLVVENKLSQDTAPLQGNRLVLWGVGGSAPALVAALPWATQVRLRYWGDLDTHGLAILAQVRRVAPHCQAVLMDTETLLAHRRHWVLEPQPNRTDVAQHLEGPQRRLWQELHDGVHGDRVRLEQEYIRFDLVEQTLGA